MSGIRSLKLVGLDNNIFIYYFEQNSQFFNYTKLIFQKLIQNELEAVTSIISLSETLSYPSPPEVLKGIEGGFAVLPNLTILEVNQDIAIEAARIRREYGFRLPDAIQLATALSANAQAFITQDQHLKSFKEIKIIPLDSLT